MKKTPNMFWIDKDPPKRGPFHYATMNSFYTSPPWRRLRNLKLAEYPTCERCLDRGIVIPAIEVHHVIEVDLRPDLALVYNNLESLCKTCHSRETASQGRKRTSKGGIYTFQMKQIDNRTI